MNSPLGYSPLGYSPNRGGPKKHLAIGPKILLIGYRINIDKLAQIAVVFLRISVSEIVQVGFTFSKRILWVTPRQSLIVG